jgi:D-3-phosphoglycerate dehydrogenase
MGEGEKIRVLLAHSAGDRDLYYGRALPHLRKLVEVRENSHDHVLTEDELAEAAQGCQIIIQHRSVAVGAGLFDRIPDVVAYLQCAVDVRAVDIAAASRNHVLVGNAGAHFVDSTMEMALGLMLAASRNIAISTAEYQAGKLPMARMGQQLAGCVAGIIGYGAIGARLSDVLLAIGMRVLVSDPYKQVDNPRIERVELATLLEQSDFVLPLAVASAETENLMDAAAFARMKRGATFINVSRGNLVDEDALQAAYRSGHIGKLAMDVGRAEDQRPSPSLAELSGVVATPHLGGLTHANADAQSMSSVEQVSAILRGEMPPRSLNPEAAIRLQRLLEDISRRVKEGHCAR